MYQFLLRILMTVVLLSLGVWSLHYNWLQRAVRYENYNYTTEEAQRLNKYPKAQYAYGMQALLKQSPGTAALFFRQAVSQNVFFLDGWLRLAESEAALERLEKAKNILTFTTGLTEKVFRWKWPQMLLALELGMTENLYNNTNYLLSQGVLEQDALHLIHYHFNGEAANVIAVLKPEHLPDYLNWLIQWSMIEESLVVWQKITGSEKVDMEIALKYAHFLLLNKRVRESKEIWNQYTGVSGLTNPGFESDITRQGFDWYIGDSAGHNWDFKRVNKDSIEGDFALKISFNGKENIHFHHIHQVVSVIPQEKYRLTYAWKSQRITSDQGPFFEIASYDRPGLYLVGPMITGTKGWHSASIEFAIPEGCQAVLIRLCRLPSQRFDSKIRGDLWLDDFRIEKLSNGERKPHGYTSMTKIDSKYSQLAFNDSPMRLGHGK